MKLHKLGYVLRDLKPENILLRVYLIDLNRALRVQASALGAAYTVLLGDISQIEKIGEMETLLGISGLSSNIIKSDMPKNDYFSCKSKRDSKYRIKHL